MVKHNGAVLTNLNLERAYDLIFYYFNSLGFKIVTEAKPTLMRLERGSTWMFDTACWKTKKCNVDLSLTKQSSNSTLIRCEYEIPTLLWEGKKDINNIEVEIQGLRNLLESSYSKATPSERERICVECKKDIPWDANLCPYCGKKYKNMKNKEDVKQVVQPEQKTAKYCTECGYQLEEKHKFCPECGEKIG